MNRFSRLLAAADQVCNRTFGETFTLTLGDMPRDITAPFEEPDSLTRLPGGGEVGNAIPTIAPLTAEIIGLVRRSEVVRQSTGEVFWVRHIGADESGRTRITLERGTPGEPAPPIPATWSKS